MSVQKVLASSKAGLAADRTLFVGTKVPTEVKLAAKILRNVDKDTFRKLLKGKVAKFHNHYHMIHALIGILILVLILIQ